MVTNTLANIYINAPEPYNSKIQRLLKYCSIKQLKNTKKLCSLINSIPNNNELTIIARENYFNKFGPKFHLYVINYNPEIWPMYIFDIIGEINHPIHKKIIILAHKNSLIIYNTTKSSSK